MLLDRHSLKPHIYLVLYIVSNSNKPHAYH